MADHFISRDQAEGDLLSAAGFLAEDIKSSDGHAEAMKSIVPLYLAKGNVDLAAELANGVAEPFSRDQICYSSPQNVPRRMMTNTLCNWRTRSRIWGCGVTGF